VSTCTHAAVAHNARIPACCLHTSMWPCKCHSWPPLSSLKWPALARFGPIGLATQRCWHHGMAESTIPDECVPQEEANAVTQRRAAPCWPEECVPQEGGQCSSQATHNPSATRRHCPPFRMVISVCGPQEVLHAHCSSATHWQEVLHAHCSSAIHVGFV
jgi:hypothetical protein